MNFVPIDDVLSIVDSIKTFSWSKLKPYNRMGGSNPIEVAHYNYGIVKEAFDSLYKITPMVENKLIKVIGRYNSNNTEFEIADLSLLDKYWHIRINVHKTYKLPINNKSPMQDLLYIWFATYQMQAIAEEGAYSNKVFGKYVYPYILKSNNIIYILFDEESISAIYSIGVVNKYNMNDGILLVRLNYWENSITQSEFRKNK